MERPEKVAAGPFGQHQLEFWSKKQRRRAAISRLRTKEFCESRNFVHCGTGHGDQRYNGSAARGFSKSEVQIEEWF
tara:strand:+ start:365 stop:592 length:228 start_codon:yes stop_codon:yes gene_type:complete